MADVYNPEVSRGANTMKVTRISEYSNALYNNRVFSFKQLSFSNNDYLFVIKGVY